MSRSAPLVFAAASALALCACPATISPFPDAGTPAVDAGTPERLARTFTSREDFKSGSYNGISDDVEGDLTIAVGQSQFATPYLWIPNSKENSISAIETRTAALVGTWPLVSDTGEPCYNPSRTTVDFDFDCWVGCRGFNSYLQSYGGQPINEVDVKVMKVSLKDGKVIKSINVGHAPRALALDARNHLWVGNSVDDTVWELDGETGQCYRGDRADCAQPSVKLGCDFPYGAVVDQKQMLWLVCRGYAGQDGRVAKVDTASGAVVGLYGPFGATAPTAFGSARGGCIQLYGISVDQLGDVWVGGFTCNDVIKLSGATGALLGVKKLGGTTTRGVAIDLDGNVWAASSSTSTVSKIEGATGNLLKTVDVPTGPIGVAVDAYGHMWAVSQSADSVTKVNGVDSTKRTTALGKGPYSYSDMLGLSLRMVTLARQAVATWRNVIDSGDDAARFTTVKWTVETPANTAFSVRVRCAATRAALSTAAFGGPLASSGAAADSAGGSCAGAAPSRFLEVEGRFTSTGTTASPALHDLTVYWVR